MKPCATCGTNPRVLSKNKGQGCYCAECWAARAAKWSRKNRDRVRHNELTRKFGISFKEYQAMEKNQGGVCAVCKEPCSSGRGLAVDHNHKTSKNRGLLCTRCNIGIGQFQDSPEILLRAIEYLKQHEELHASKQ